MDLLVERVERVRRCRAQKLRLRNEALLPRRFLPRRSVFFTSRFKIVARTLQLALGFPPLRFRLRELRFQIAARDD